MIASQSLIAASQALREVYLLYSRLSQPLSRRNREGFTLSLTRSLGTTAHYMRVKWAAMYRRGQSHQRPNRPQVDES